ncbi:hypothetical protein BD309DRAFT_989924 [Dichomitus squalens]|uniref:Uncharacterized protein n=1 Tax=Dichomitus squalens TaxID=114155 RepID=A0A4Q9NTH1_9APHY|nr:hypothetical protein BD311DRAFT_777605 [Dichomitus squalens]TBU44954.1 hypothetical protein BD309DRAFT_989924 [Dichomitus squalens]
MAAFNMNPESTTTTAVPSPIIPAVALPKLSPTHTLAPQLATTEPSIPTPPLSPRRDDEFYCQDVVFLRSFPTQVGGVLFKVPRRPFEHDSKAFSDTFGLPPLNSAYGVEGSNDDNPIKLEGVTEEEFRPLLWVMFRAGYGSARILTQPQWTSVLRLATMWIFDDIRERAITELSRLVTSPAARIVLARRYNIPGWLEPALTTLAQQEQPLSAQDLEALGWETAAKLFQIRESVTFTGTCVCGCNYCTVAHGHIANATAGHAHGHGQQLPAGARAGAVTLAALRKQADFSQKIRVVFGADLY